MITLSKYFQYKTFQFFTFILWASYIIIVGFKLLTKEHFYTEDQFTIAIGITLLLLLSLLKISLKNYLYRDQLQNTNKTDQDYPKKNYFITTLFTFSMIGVAFFIIHLLFAFDRHEFGAIVVTIDIFMSLISICSSIIGLFSDWKPFLSILFFNILLLSSLIFSGMLSYFPGA